MSVLLVCKKYFCRLYVVAFVKGKVLMYNDIIVLIEKSIEDLLNECGVQIEALCGHYDDWGKVCSVENILDSTNKTTGFLIDVKQYIVSNYKEQKYLTKTVEGKIKFWEYDYKNWVPVNCCPQIVIFSKTSSELFALYNKIYDVLKEKIIINIQHPILKNNVIPISLSIEKFDDVNLLQIREDLFCSEICFNKFIYPFYVTSICNSNPNIQTKNKFIMELIFALLGNEYGCQQFIEKNSSNSDLVIHHKEKLFMMKENIRELFNIIGIPDTMRDLSHLRRINNKIINTNISIKEATDIVENEDKEYEIQVEKERMKKHQDSRFNWEQDISYVNNNYSYDNSDHGILFEMVKDVADYAQERKNKKDAAKPHLLGSYGCQYLKYHTCALCRLRNKCADCH